jgi:hypothetical protein
MYMHLSPQRMSVPPPARGRPARLRSDPVESVGLPEATGIISIVLLVLAIVSHAPLRGVLSSAGLIGLLGLRLAAAERGWARRGAAWPKKAAQQMV